MFTMNTGLPSVAGHFLAGNITLAECGFEYLNLPYLISLMSHSEIARKAFYTLFLGLTWSDVSIRTGYYDPSAEEYEIPARKSTKISAIIDYDLAHLFDDDVKDPRVGEGRAGLITLACAHYYPHLLGHRSNFILTPKTAGDDYRRKLLQLSEADLDQLFHNIPDYPRTESQAAKLNAIVDQAVSAAQDWQTYAVQNHRPIYTGTSGHMLSYARIFFSSEDPSGGRRKDHPNVEQLRSPH
jgi:hypothetical protein